MNLVSSDKLIGEIFYIENGLAEKIQFIIDKINRDAYGLTYITDGIWQPELYIFASDLEFATGLEPEKILNIISLCATKKLVTALNVAVLIAIS